MQSRGGYSPVIFTANVILSRKVVTGGSSRPQEPSFEDFVAGCCIFLLFLIKQKLLFVRSLRTYGLQEVLWRSSRYRRLRSISSLSILGTMLSRTYKLIP